MEIIIHKSLNFMSKHWFESS